MFLSLSEFKKFAEENSDDLSVIYPYELIPEYEREQISTIFSLGSRDGPGVGIISILGKMYIAEALDLESFPRKFLILDIKSKDMNVFLNYCLWYSRYKSDGICYNWDGNSGACLTTENNTLELKEDLTHPLLQIDIGYAKIVGWFSGWKKVY